jgi:hypothetical protein
VTIYRLITSGTIEEKVYHRQVRGGGIVEGLEGCLDLCVQGQHRWGRWLRLVLGGQEGRV